MNRLLLCAVLGLAALVCLSMADDGSSLVRDVRRAKHADKHKREEETPGTPIDGYTVVTIPKTASKPTLVDSLMSMINNAGKAAAGQDAASTLPPTIDEVTTVSSAPGESITTTTTTSEPVGGLNSNIVTENEVKGGDVTVDDDLATPRNHTDEDDLDTASLMPLVDKVSSFALELNNTLDAPALAGVCEESRRQLVKMFNKVIGQLSDLFNSMYVKMSAIATQQTAPAN